MSTHHQIIFPFKKPLERNRFLRYGCFVWSSPAVDFLLNDRTLHHLFLLYQCLLKSPCVYIYLLTLKILINRNTNDNTNSLQKYKNAIIKRNKNEILFFFSSFPLYLHIEDILVS